MRISMCISRRMATALGIFVTVSALFIALPQQSAQAAKVSGKYKNFGKSAADISAKWKQLKPVQSSSNLFAAAPKLSSPYNTVGSLSSATLNNGLNAVNFYRYLAGLGSVKLNINYNSQCQTGAYVLALNGVVSHEPARPSGVSKSLYDTAAYACIRANLHRTASSSISNTLLYDSVYSFMQSDRSANIAQVGHRRWVLNYAMGQTGFGAVTSGSGTYAAMFATDTSSTAAKPAYVAWPAPGYMPTEVIAENIPWSISLDSSVYNTNSPVEVTMYAIHSGKTYKFSSSKKDGDFFTDSTYGSMKYTLIWRPSGETLSKGHAYDIRIRGLKNRNGAAMPDIQYSVKFFSAESQDDGSASTPATNKPSSSAPPANGQNGIVTSGGKTYYYKSGKQITGWMNDNGTWYYYLPEQARGWNSIDGKWYYFNGNGAMKTGWHSEGSKWYYLRSGGDMATGWAQVGSNWHYFNGSGIMQTGWVQSGGKWYYLNSAGVMLTGWQSIGGSWYYFNGGGVMATGWVHTGSWYYCDGSGRMQTGWIQLGSAWYWLDGSGKMATGTVTINGTLDTFDSSGRWIK